MSLTPKQQRFIEEYLIDCNAAAAARRAGYSEHTANRQGYENLTKPDVQAALVEAQRERAQRVGLSADHVLDEYQRLAFNDLRQLFVTLPDGALRLRPVSEWPDSIGRSLAGIKVRQETRPKADGTFTPMEVVEFRLHSKVEALRDLAKHLGILKDAGGVNIIVQSVHGIEPAEALGEARNPRLHATGGGPATLPLSGA